MSDALNYLMKARPEAMRSYFAFLKESGKHLDPKTRAIISVITKVDNQTEAGFRQYLKRALQADVSANEIIDALLTAFPTLGLTKIVWAVDILLEMDIPEFQLDKLAEGEVWHDVCAISEFNQEVKYLVSDDKGIFIYRDDSFHVYDSQCPHQANCISEQCLVGFDLTCNRHGWRFDIRTGECVEKGDRPLTRLECKVEKDRLLVLW